MSKGENLKAARVPKSRRQGTWRCMDDFREMVWPLYVALNLADADSPPVSSVEMSVPIARYIKTLVRAN